MGLRHLLRNSSRSQVRVEEQVRNDATYVPNEQLSLLIGRALYSLSFVYDDRVELRFEQTDAADEAAVLECSVWPVVERDGRTWWEPDPGYADALRALGGGVVVATTEQTGLGLRIEFDTDTVILHPHSRRSFSRSRFSGA